MCPEHTRRELAGLEGLEPPTLSLGNRHHLYEERVFGVRVLPGYAIDAIYSIKRYFGVRPEDNSTAME